MAHVQVKGCVLRAVMEKIIQEHREKLYRPTVVGILECLPTGNILMVETRGGRFDPYWCFPQGGIEAGEFVIDALFREVREETGVSSDGLIVRKYLGTDTVHIPSWKRDGFVMGKTYTYFYVTSERIPRLVPDGREVTRCRWTSRAEAMFFLRELRARPEVREKADGMHRALARAFLPA